MAHNITTDFDKPPEEMRMGDMATGEFAVIVEGGHTGTCVRVYGGLVVSLDNPGLTWGPSFRVYQGRSTGLKVRRLSPGENFTITITKGY